MLLHGIMLRAFDKSTILYKIIEEKVNGGKQQRGDKCKFELNKWEEAHFVSICKVSTTQTKHLGT